MIKKINYKRVLALALTGEVILLSGCNKKNDNNKLDFEESIVTTTNEVIVEQPKDYYDLINEYYSNTNMSISSYASLTTEEEKNEYIPYNISKSDLEYINCYVRAYNGYISSYERNDKKKCEEYCKLMFNEFQELINDNFYTKYIFDYSSSNLDNPSIMSIEDGKILLDNYCTIEPLFKEGTYETDNYTFMDFIKRDEFNISENSMRNYNEFCSSTSHIFDIFNYNKEPQNRYFIIPKGDGSSYYACCFDDMMFYKKTNLDMIKDYYKNEYNLTCKLNIKLVDGEWYLQDGVFESICKINRQNFIEILNSVQHVEALYSIASRSYTENNEQRSSLALNELYSVIIEWKNQYEKTNTVQKKLD